MSAFLHFRWLYLLILCLAVVLLSFRRNFLFVPSDPPVAINDTSVLYLFLKPSNSANRNIYYLTEEDGGVWVANTVVSDGTAAIISFAEDNYVSRLTVTFLPLRV